MSSQPTSIAYISHSFPLLTETFVYREIFGLERKGFRVVTFAIWKPDKNKISQEVRHLVDTTHYVFPISWPEFVRAHLYFLGTRPGKYLGTLRHVLTGKGESWENRRRTFIHFCDAIYLAREMERQDVRHIHAHFAINAATIALVASRMLDISYSFTAHNSFFTDRVILKQKATGARFIIAISEFSKQFLNRLVPGDDIGAKIHIVHCGLSPDNFAPPNPKPVNDVPIMLFVAQLAERKGAPYLVEACRILAERGVGFRCVIVGDGPQMELVKELVQRYGLREVVELPGVVFQENLKEYLRRADVFVLPCITTSTGDVDGVPVSLMEAMSMEIATVSTDVSGIPELIENGVSGVLVPEKDPGALADALQRLLEDGELRLRLGKSGREKVVREFNTDRGTAQLADLFAQYLKVQNT
jgi:colanic acid/amylovoran biosynthesis glycosyltransferase